MEKENIDKEFTDIDKGIENKNYIIVIILYVIVAVLSVFLILGIKNQKDTVKDNINDEEPIEEIKENDDAKQKEQQQNNNETQDSNNIFDDAREEVDDFNSKQNEQMEDELNILNQLR